MTQLSEVAEVEISGGIAPIAGVATYKRAEYSLVYQPTATGVEVNAIRSASGAWRQSGRRIFVTSGFVTLTFEGEPLIFTKLDAYANDARWVEREITLSAMSGQGALVLVADRLEDDHCCFGREPLFEIDRSLKTLRITFAERTERYFQIGTALYAGIGEHRLTSLILGEVQFI